MPLFADSMIAMFANQKAQEISYALVRVAAHIRRQEMRQRIERLSFELLEETAKENFSKALLISSAIEQVISLGRSIYEIEPINIKILLGELSVLNSAMRQSSGLEELPDFREIFSSPPAIIENGNTNQDNVAIRQYESGNPSTLRDTSGQAGSGRTRQENGNHENGSGIGATIRQSAIIDKIRQTANRQAQLKDLIAAFPDASERTMRYDLQKLCNQGLIERVGNGGPGVYYILKS